MIDAFEFHGAGLEDDIAADVAVDAELRFGRAANCRRRSSEPSTVSVAPCTPVNVRGVEGGGDVTGLARLQHFLFDRGRRAAATRRTLKSSISCL